MTTWRTAHRPSGCPSTGRRPRSAPTRTNPEGDLKVNETHQHKIVSNTRGTAAIAHWDVPDCGNSEFFINLSANAHLDSAYGGYCVFAEVDAVSFKIVDAIADAIANQQKKMVRITSVVLV